LDTIGLDVCHHIIAYLDVEWGERFVEAALLRALVEDGRLGRKSGQGFYAYDGGRTEYLDLLIARVRAPGRGAWRAPPPKAVDRTMAMLLNEAFLCVEEEIAGVGDVDLACKLGLGMQVNWEGERAVMGPLEYADRVGPDVLLARFEGLEEELGPRFRPAKVLRGKVQAGERFIR
jgi:3-hydroxyacyl-CoA dehydrogenase